MHLGQLNKNIAIVVASAIIGMIASQIFNRKFYRDINFRLNCLEAAHEASIPQGNFRGFNIETINKMFKLDQSSQRSRFVYDPKKSKGSVALIPEYYKGSYLEELSFDYNNGVMFIWILVDTREVVWDCYIDNDTDL